MKVLVTGANGFIGGHLTKILVDEGYDVRCMVQPGTSTELLGGLDVEIVDGDLLDPSSLRLALRDCQQLYHLAAIYAVWHPTPSLLYRVNVEGTVFLMREAMEAGIERIVHTSSIAAIGVNPDGTPADEATQYNQWETFNEYVMSKYVSELEVHRLVKDGLPAVIVNPAFPFGWGDIGPTPTGKLVLTLLQGKFPVYFDGGFNGVDVRDVARGHYLAMQNGTIGQRYILSGHNVTYDQFVKQVCRIGGVTPPRFKVSANFVATLGKLAELVADHITHKEPPVVDKGVRYTAQKLFFDNAKAKRELGYDPHPLDEAIGESVRWFKSRGLS
ncbi:MAG: SDR family oxidoreductase [Myxococcales bacterium]|nr:SDR family oxidoreductase [Myxococcales bacterium]